MDISSPEYSIWRAQIEAEIYAEYLILQGPSFTNTTPISRLPNELLSDIFVKSAHTETKMYGGHPSEYPVLLGRWPTNIAQVSRLWRDVAISTPRLWSRISLGLPLSVRPRSNPQSRAQVMDTALRRWTEWLEWSSASPLFLELEFDDLRHIGGNYRESIHFMSSILHTLLDHVHRVQDLTIHASTLGNTSDMAVPQATVSLSSLERLCVAGFSKSSLHWHRARSQIPFITALFHKASKLRWVTLHSTHIGPEANVPYSQLTHLDIYGQIQVEEDALSLQRLASILNECPHLTTLQIRAEHIASPLIWQMPILPSLQHLLIVSNPGIISIILNNFSNAGVLPALKRLTISCNEGQERPECEQSLETFFQTHAETLCEFTLGAEHKRYRPKDLPSSLPPRILKAIPRLPVLSLYGHQSDVSEAYMDALSFKIWPPMRIANAPRILEDGHVPFLSSLTVMFPLYEFQSPGMHYVDVATVKYEMSCLATLVDSRWRVPDTLIADGQAARLNKLCVDETQWMWMARHVPDAYERIKACVDEGLQLSFDVEEPPKQASSFD